MTKLCPRGKAAAKRKFKVYPSAYANAYASKICAGKIKDPSGVKRKDFKGPKPARKAMGGRIGFKKGTGRTGVPAMDIKTKISLAKKKKNKKSDLGMQSVKYGIDNNPDITAADPKAKFIAANKKNKKSKKKVI